MVGPEPAWAQIVLSAKLHCNICSPSCTYACSNLHVKHMADQYCHPGIPAWCLAPAPGQSQPPRHLSMFLEVSEREGDKDWSAFVSHRLVIVNQRDEQRSLVKESQVPTLVSRAFPGVFLTFERATC